MKSLYKNLINSFITFIICFLLYRLAFLAFYFNQLPTTHRWQEILGVFTHSIALDAAMAAIYLIIPWLILSLYSLIRSKVFIYLLKLYLIIVVCFHSFIAIAELGVYGEWGSKPGYGILRYLDHISEILHSVQPLYAVIFSLIAIITLAILFKLIHYLIYQPQTVEKRNPLLLAVFYFAMPVLIIVIGRGGFSEIPISTSDAFFSKNQIINDAAVNSSYQFVFSVISHIDLIKGENPYKLDEAEKDPALIEPLLHQDCQPEPILGTKTPNIAFVILESWSADIVETGGGYKGLTPFFESMIKQGIYFSNAYGVGMLSHDGIPASLSAFPQVPELHITDEINKVRKLPSLAKSLKQGKNYHTSFLFGGQLRYGNIKSYIYNSGFDQIQEGKDIPENYPRGSLGVPDGDMFNYFLKQLDKKRTPFFSVAYTLSSHSPYDQPMDDVIDWGGRDKGYLNSVVYVDKSLKSFIRQAKQKSWYKNTLFVFVADHGHIIPKDWKRNQKERRRIPILFYGEPIKKSWRGTVINKVASQINIAATLLGQLNINSNAYHWSKDMLCKDYYPFAYYALTTRGFGIISEQGYLTYQYDTKTVGYQEIPNNDEKIKNLLIKQGKNYLDDLFTTYLNL